MMKRALLGMRSFSSSVGEPAAIVVTLFTKPDCSLCIPVHETILEVQKLAESPAFEYVQHDIDQGDRSIFFKYRYDIPVITVNGNEVARHRLEKSVLVAVLADLQE
jgi:hypothetical protein